MKRTLTLLLMLPATLFGDGIPALFPTDGVLVSEGTNGNVVATNDVSSYVDLARDDGTDAWIVGRDLTSAGADAANSVALTNTAVRWNKDLGCWQVKIEGTRHGESVDGWYVGAVFDGDPLNLDDSKYLTPGHSGPFEVTNSNPRATVVTTLKFSFSGNESHTLYAVRKSEPVVAGLLDLASKSEVSSLASSKRDLTNSVCVADAGFTPWVLNIVRTDGATVEQQQPDFYILDEGWWSIKDDEGRYWSTTGDEDATSLTFEDFGLIIATRSRVAYSNDTYATYVFVTNAVNAGADRAVNAYKDLHYDAALEVAWTNVYDNGHVYMVTVTNTNVSVAQ